MRLLWCASVLVFMVFIDGCAKPRYQLRADRYEHERFPYAVLYEPGGSPASPLNGPWLVDNFTNYGDPRAPYTPKKGPDYNVERRYDTDGDGQAEQVATEPFYDLMLEHLHKEARMWLRTVPVSSKDARKDLDVLAERYVQSAAGAGSVLVRFGAEGALGVIERRFASRTLQTWSCELSGREAVRVDFEVADVDQIQLSQQARWERGSVVLVRTGYKRTVQGRYQQSARFPVFLLIGMSARPQDFEALGEDYDRLLSQTVLGEAGGPIRKEKTTCIASEAPRESAAAGDPEGDPEGVEAESTETGSAPAEEAAPAGDEPADKVEPAAGP